MSSVHISSQKYNAVITISSSKENSNNTAINSSTQASNNSIVNPSSPITDSTTSTTITTTTTATATSSSIGGTYAILDQIEMSSKLRSESEYSESDLFGTSTRITSRNTLGDYSNKMEIAVDVHHTNDSTESDDNHLDKKRRKIQKVVRPKKTNLRDRTKSSDSELNESEDISKQPRPRGPKGHYISKKDKNANDVSVNIVGENSCVVESDASVKEVRGWGRPPKSSLNKMAKSILEHDAEREKNRQA